jgi:G:T-mismatch repair DNA endonuclease (very short patch repair protein)
MSNIYKLNKKCRICEKLLTDINKTGYCNLHRDRTGKNNSFYGKKHNKKTIEIIKIKNSQISKNLWKNKIYRDKIIKGVSKPRISSFKNEQSIRIKQWYKDNPVQKDIRSKAMRKNWKNGIITKNNFSCNESTLEKNFISDLRNKTGLDIIKKTIKGEKRWFFPDMLDKGAKTIIEYYGDFWHANPEKYSADQIVTRNNTAQQIWDKDEKRISALKELGYDVIIVWQSDYKKDKESILNNLNNYLNWESCSF